MISSGNKRKIITITVENSFASKRTAAGKRLNGGEVRRAKRRGFTVIWYVPAAVISLKQVVYAGYV
jgi:hypothetical protein